VVGLRRRARVVRSGRPSRGRGRGLVAGQMVQVVGLVVVELRERAGVRAGLMGRRVGSGRRSVGRRLRRR